MNVLFRIMLAFYAFCLAILSAFIMLITFEHRLLDSIYYYITDAILVNKTASTIVFLIALLFFALSILFLLSGFKSSKDPKGVSNKTDIGEIKISLDAVESISLATSRKVRGVSSTKASVEMLDDNSVLITVKMEVLHDVVIPSTSEEMQKEVKHAVENISGIKVSGVKVVVENISKEDVYKP